MKNRIKNADDWELWCILIHDGQRWREIKKLEESSTGEKWYRKNDEKRTNSYIKYF